MAVIGVATTLAVVSASILILAFDYVLTEMFFARSEESTAAAVGIAAEAPDSTLE